MSWSSNYPWIPSSLNYKATPPSSLPAEKDFIHNAAPIFFNSEEMMSYMINRKINLDISVRVKCTPELIWRV